MIARLGVAEYLWNREIFHFSLLIFHWKFIIWLDPIRLFEDFGYWIECGKIAR